MNGPKAWMPWYVGDYLGETGRLTTEQHGAYALLICDYWLNGPPPADDTVLAKIARLEGRVWRRHAPLIRALFREEGGVLRHARLDKERAAVDAKYAQASERARHASRKRWEQAQAPGDARDHASGNARGKPRAMPQPCQSQSEPHSQSQPQPPEAPCGPGEPDPEIPSAQGSPASPAPVVGAAPRDETPGSPAAEPLPGEPPFIELPLMRGGMFHVAHELVARLQGQYPAVDVAQQLRQMQAWLLANPRLGKTERGMMRFVTGWLGRQQGQAPSRPPVSYLGPEDLL